MRSLTGRYGPHLMIVMTFVTPNNFQNGPGISNRLLGLYPERFVRLLPGSELYPERFVRLLPGSKLYPERFVRLLPGSETWTRAAHRTITFLYFCIYIRRFFFFPFWLYQCSAFPPFYFALLYLPHSSTLCYHNAESGWRLHKTRSCAFASAASSPRLMCCVRLKWQQLKRK